MKIIPICLIENPTQKEQLLVFVTNLGAQPVTQLSQCGVFLQHISKLQAKLCKCFETVD